MNRGFFGGGSSFDWLPSDRINRDPLFGQIGLHSETRFYYLCLVGGEELANRLLLPPWLAMWLANIVIGWFGIRWTLQACELVVNSRRALPGTRGT